MVASRRHGLELLRFAGLMIGCLPILGIAGNLVNQKLFSCGSVCDWHCLIFGFVGKNLKTGYTSNIYGLCLKLPLEGTQSETNLPGKVTDCFITGV